MPVPGQEPGPKDPLGRLKEHPKSKQRQQKVVAAIREGSAEVADLGPLFLHHDKDLVRAAALIAADVKGTEPVLVQAHVLPRIAGADKGVAVAVVQHLASMSAEDLEAAVSVLTDSELVRDITELMDVARPRELKEALKGEDKLRARVAVAEVVRRGAKGEALLYEARSSKDRVVAAAGLAALRAMFLGGDLKPRARIDSFWLWRTKLFS